MRHTTAKVGVAALVVTLVTGTAMAVRGGQDPRRSTSAPLPEATTAPANRSPVLPGVVTLAFAGDVHFQLHLAALAKGRGSSLGPMSRALADADVAMVNLESAVTERGVPEAKELEVPDRRYYYRTSPGALDLLHAAGVDVVSVANNHGADYGRQGLRDTLRAARTSPVAVLGVGRNQRAAFAPYRVTVNGTRLAFLAADGSPREGGSSVWAAGPTTPGIAAARTATPRALLDAVRAAGREADVVVVYLHWGRELQGCPTPKQRATARALAEAGADVLVGSHAHVLLGSGWADDTYVSYGLGNFLWYHDHQPETGVLRLRIEDGEVVDDTWVPARIGTWGRPFPVRGPARSRAVADWHRLRGCAGLASRPSGPSPVLRYVASVRRVGPGLQARMHASHGERCPVPWRDLRHLRITYVGFDGRDHTGEMVVASRYARAVVRVFERLYDARWPIRRMRLVDAYDGDDDRSMAANNTSAYNCRRVAGHRAWSAHAYGTAIDINPVQNPYLTPSSIAPTAGRRFAAIDRSAGAAVPRGAVRTGDVVVRAFTDIGWEWGGAWSTSPDYQHFSAGASSR